jgi:hypothetical protein
MYGAVESTWLVTPLMDLCKLLILGLVLASLFHDCKLVLTNSAIAEHIDHHGGSCWHQEFDYGLVLYSLKQEFGVVVLKGAFFQPKLGWNSTYTAWIFDSASDLEYAVMQLHWPNSSISVKSDKPYFLSSKWKSADWFHPSRNGSTFEVSLV